MYNTQSDTWWDEREAPPVEPELLTEADLDPHGILCPSCKGQGVTYVGVEVNEFGTWDYENQIDCLTCNGSGEI